MEQRRCTGRRPPWCSSAFLKTQYSNNVQQYLVVISESVVVLNEVVVTCVAVGLALLEFETAKV